MQQDRKPEIDQLLLDYKNRGEMTRQQFCDSRGMKLSALDYYLRRYNKTEPPQHTPRLAPVTVAHVTSPAAGGFRLVLANGRTIECGPAELEQLIRVAEVI
jgi:hypothetical protein